MSAKDKIRKLCRICGDVGSINIFGSFGQSLDLSEKINTLLPIHVRTCTNKYLILIFFSFFIQKNISFVKFNCIILIL